MLNPKFCVAGIASLGTPIASAGLVNFELLPDGTQPNEGIVVSTQFESLHGMAFSLVDGEHPIIVKSGSNRYSAFASSYGVQNVPAPGQNVGDYFLADPHVVDGTAPSPLHVEFTTAVHGARGVVLDVDGDEQYTVTAHSASGGVIKSIVIQVGSPNTGDGLAAPWEIVLDGAQIASITIALSTPTELPGFAFDNFTFQACAADVDWSGYVDGDDYNSFIAAFESGSEAADLDGTGYVDLEDFIAFVNAFEAGC
jgi:hypothetical protein